MSRPWIKRLALVFLLLSYGCASTKTSPSPEKVIDCEPVLRHDRQVFKGKIGLFPLRVVMCEIKTGGKTEEVPQWSLEGKKIVKKCLLEHFGEEQGVEIFPLTDLSDVNRELLENHRELLNIIAANRAFINRTSGWNHLKDRVDTIGNGLAGLRDTIGVDAILFVEGFDLKATKAHKTTSIVTAVLLGATVGVAPIGPMDFCFLSTGLIDLETGEVIWTNGSGGGAYSLKNEQHVEEIIDATFHDFPSSKTGNDVNVPIE